MDGAKLLAEAPIHSHITLWKHIVALLAEQLVDEWLNRRGFFTLRGARSGVAEIDLLGVRQRDGALEGWHVEVQVSFRPVSYLSRLAKSDQDELKAQSPTSAKARPAHILQRGINAWVEKKFRANTKIKMRDQVWPGIPKWKEFFVHGKVRDGQELAFIQKHGIELVPFSNVLDELSKPKCLSGIMSLKTLPRSAWACTSRRTKVQHASSDQALSGLASMGEVPSIFNHMIPDRH